MLARVIRLCVGSLVAWGGGGLLAQTRDTSQGDMAEARREFQELKATQGMPDSTKLELPTVKGPNMPSTTPAPPAPATPRQREELLQARRKAERERNWLVNGVMDLDKPKRIGRRDPTMIDPTAALDPFAQALAEQNQLPFNQRDNERTQGGAQNAKATDEKTLLKTPNPLDAFMMAWISPRDRQLLLPSSGAAEGSSAALPSPGGALGDRPTAGATEPASGPDLSPAPSGNPYLDNPPPAPIPAAPRPPPPSTAILDSSVAPTPGPARTDPPPAAVQRKNDLPAPLAKPDDDEKYFPQLKRF